MPIAVRVGQEVLDLLQFLFGLEETSNVIKCDLGLVLGDQLRFGLAELHDTIPATLHLHEDEDHETEQEEPWEEADENLPETGRLRVGRPGSTRFLDDGRQLELEALDVVGNVFEYTLFSGTTGQAAPGLARAPEKNHLAVRAILDILHELGNVDLFGGGHLIEPPREEDGDEDDRHPVDHQCSESAAHKDLRLKKG